MPQVEERLAEALREIANTAFADREPDCTVESLTAWLRTIVGPALAEYDKPRNADYPECSGDPNSCPENEGHGCCNRTPSPASPSLVGEGQPVGYIDKDGVRKLRNDEVCDFVTPWKDEDYSIGLYLAAQASKPASAGGEQLSHSDGGVPAATCPCCGGSIDWDYWEETGRARCKQCRLEALSLSNWNRRAIAAEADTEKK